MIVCCLFNKIIAGKSPLKYLSTDNDPLFTFHRWQANLRILEVDEIKTVPACAVSHPFVERVIGTTRREYLDQMLFFNAVDLQRKLNVFKQYYNQSRSHSALELKTPKQKGGPDGEPNKVVKIDKIRWQSYCQGLFDLPVAA